MPVIAGPMELARRYRTSYQRPPGSHITSQERYKTNQHSGIRRASARRAKRRWSDSSLQVEDPKASGTPTCVATTCATFLGSAAVVAAHSIMQSGPLTKALVVSAWHLHSEPPPSITLSERSRTDRQSSWSVAAPLLCCVHGSATSERAASCSHRVRPRVPRWPSGLCTATLRDDVGLSQRPAACSRRTQRWGHGCGRLGRYTVA